MKTLAIIFAFIIFSSFSSALLANVETTLEGKIVSTQETKVEFLKEIIEKTKNRFAKQGVPYDEAEKKFIYEKESRNLNSKAFLFLESNRVEVTTTAKDDEFFVKIVIDFEAEKVVITTNVPLEFVPEYSFADDLEKAITQMKKDKTISADIVADWF